VFEKIVQFYGSDKNTNEFIEFVEEFKNLRGDYGLRQDDELNNQIHPDISNLHKLLQARPKMEEKTHEMFVRTIRAKAKQPDIVVKGKKEPSEKEDSDEIPDEPLNRDKLALQQDLVYNYSFNRYTGTIPADRVKLDSVSVKYFRTKQKRDDVA